MQAMRGTPCSPKADTPYSLILLILLTPRVPSRPIPMRCYTTDQGFVVAIHGWPVSGRIATLPPVSLHMRRPPSIRAQDSSRAVVSSHWIPDQASHFPQAKYQSRSFDYLGKGLRPLVCGIYRLVPLHADLFMELTGMTNSMNHNTLRGRLLRTPR